MNIIPKRLYLTTIMGCCAAFCLFAQEPDTSLRFKLHPPNTRLQEMAERTDAEMDYSDFTDDLSRLGKHRVNLNAASDQDLRRLTFLNELQLANLRAYLQQYGSIVTIYELNMIEGFNQEVIGLMIPYIILKPQSPFSKITLPGLLHYGNTELVVRYQQVLEQQKGFQPASDSLLHANPNARYLGGPGRLYTRFKYAYSDRLQLGFTAEKDPGETFFPANDTLRKGFDFYSAHIYYEGPGVVKQIALGDYHVQFGQGLTLWSGLSYGKLPGEMGGKKSGQGIKPSSSSNENLFMRGAAATIGSKKTQLTLFYSSHAVDANLLARDTLDEGDALYASLQESGYHRTPNELADKQRARIEAAGGHIGFKTGTLHLGATAYQVKLDKGRLSPSAPASLFDLTKQSMMNAGVDFDYRYKKLNLYGEVARSDKGAVAHVNGMTFAADPRFVISVIYRNYPKDYTNLICSAFAESSRPVNEKGLYMGFIASLASKWTLTASVDQFKFGWLRYRVDAPSFGAEYTARLNWQVSEKCAVEFRFREAHKQMNTAENGYFNVLQNTDHHAMRFQLSFSPNTLLWLKSRIEYSEYHDSKNTTDGFLVYQDIGIKAPQRNLSLAARFALFDVPAYSNRLYAYENDVRYAFTTASYYGVGSRFYLVAAWQWGKHIDLWVKYSRTLYTDRQVISSGLDEIAGNNRSEIKLQLLLSL